MQTQIFYPSGGKAIAPFFISKKVIVAAFLYCSFCSLLTAQLAYWDMQLDGVPPNPYLATRSSYIVQSAYAFTVPSANSTGSPAACNGDAWSTAFWPATSSRRTSEYVHFELTIASGSAANVANFQFLSNLSSNNAAKDFDVYYSTNNFSSETFLLSGSSEPGGCGTFSSDLDVNLSGGESIGFRIYFYNSNAAATAATTRLDNVQIFGSLLPIELAYFKGEAEGQSVLLQWQTQAEANNDYMAVERSEDGRHFRELGRVRGAGNSGHPREYSWRDETPWPGVNYYRLRQVDFDGAEEYFEPIAVDFDGRQPNGGIIVFPTLVASDLNLRIKDSFNEAATLEIVGADGRRHLSRRVGQQSSVSTLNVSRLPAGPYYLRLFDGRKAAFARFQKR